VPDKTTVLKTRADNSEKQNLQSKHTGEMSGITFDKAKFNVGLRDNVINMLGKIESSVESNTKVSVRNPTNCPSQSHNGCREFDFPILILPIPSRRESDSSRSFHFSRFQLENPTTVHRSLITAVEFLIFQYFNFATFQ
ncbi:hypothetical protein AVEN_243391-1, partial [Araneus ventricosus]